MDTKKYLDLVGLKHYDSKIKTFIANSIANAEATYTDSLIKKDENGAIINPWQIITDETLLNQAPTSKAVLDYVGTFAKSVKDTVEGLSVNNKTFGTTGEVVLYAGDIKMSDATDATTVKAEIEGLKGAVSGGTFFRGVFDSTDAVVDPKNGDVVVVKVKDAEGNVIGDKEYIYNSTTSEWVELGDVTAEQQRISALEGEVADIKAEIGVDGNVDTATGLYQLIRQREEAIMEAIGEFSTDNENGTGLCLEIEERDADTLASANAYTDEKVKDITGGNYVKSFGGKTGDITLSAEGNVTLEMVDNALKASYDDTNVDGISWKETQAITTDEIDALFA